MNELEKRYNELVKRYNKEENDEKRQKLNISMENTREDNLIFFCLKKIKSLLNEIKIMENSPLKNMYITDFNVTCKKINKLFDEEGWK